MAHTLIEACNSLSVHVTEISILMVWWITASIVWLTLDYTSQSSHNMNHSSWTYLFLKGLYEVLGNLLQRGECKPRVWNSSCEVIFPKRKCYFPLSEGRQTYNNQKFRIFWSCGSGPPVVNSIALISHIWPRYRRPKFWNNFFNTKSAKWENK